MPKDFPAPLLPRGVASPSTVSRNSLPPAMVPRHLAKIENIGARHAQHAYLRSSPRPHRGVCSAGFLNVLEPCSRGPTARGVLLLTRRGTRAEVRNRTLHAIGDCAGEVHELAVQPVIEHRYISGSDTLKCANDELWQAKP